MKNFLATLCLLFFCVSAGAHGDPDAPLRKEVNAFMDEWHDDAAKARLAFFEKIAPHGVYIGTDKTELWQRDAFKVWAARFFERKSAWAFKPVQRNVYVSADKKFVWFDEQVETQMGICQASGVLRRVGNSFLIEHYQLSIAVPNGVANKVTETIKEYEAKAVVK